MKNLSNERGMLQNIIEGNKLSYLSLSDAINGNFYSYTKKERIELAEEEREAILKVIKEDYLLKIVRSGSKNYSAILYTNLEGLYSNWITDRLVVTNYSNNLKGGYIAGQDEIAERVYIRKHFSK